MLFKPSDFNFLLAQLVIETLSNDTLSFLIEDDIFSRFDLKNSSCKLNPDTANKIDTKEFYPLMIWMSTSDLYKLISTRYVSPNFIDPNIGMSAYSGMPSGKLSDMYSGTSSTLTGIKYRTDAKVINIVCREPKETPEFYVELKK